MFVFVQYHRSPYGEFKRHWNYKTKSGARRRVWLCNQSAGNIRAYIVEV